jgi:hypothetical protein
MRHETKKTKGVEIVKQKERDTRNKSSRLEKPKFLKSHPCQQGSWKFAGASYPRISPEPPTIGRAFWGW